MHRRVAILATLALPAAAASTPAWALDQIIRSYQSVRSEGMGGLKLTTGLYDENFFGNPSRVVYNPMWRTTALDAEAEGDWTGLGNIGNLTGGNNSSLLTNIASSAGENNHARFETTFPSIYLPPTPDGDFGLAFGIITSTQADIALRRSFEVDPTVISDVSFAATIGHQYLEENQLALGITPHVSYRISGQQGYSLVDFLKGTSINPRQTGGDGVMLDLDLGMSYRTPWTLWEDYRGEGFRFSFGASLNNLAGGTYNNLHLHILKTGNLPVPEPRSGGVGFNLFRPSWGVFENVTFGLEFQDIGNNVNGSLFRTVHLGGEARFKLLLLRAGLYQGYWTLGAALDFRVITIEAATYSEEMSLNVGGYEDRRFALHISFQGTSSVDDRRDGRYTRY